MKTIVVCFFYFSVLNVYATEEKEVLSRIKKYGMTLKNELKAGLKKSPQEAVRTCHLRAGEIQRDLSNDKVKIGRVSLKNRNPENYPKQWMLSYIDEFHRNKIKKKYIVVDLENKKNGLLMPIKTEPLCLKCHGVKIEKGLKREITKLYPKDKAIGYKVGQIRGFFWAEY